MDPNILKPGDLVKIVNPGYNLRVCVGEFTCHWSPKHLGEKIKEKEMVMIQFPGYAAERAFEKKQCVVPTKDEMKEYFVQKLRYGN